MWLNQRIFVGFFEVQWIKWSTNWIVIEFYSMAANDIQCMSLCSTKHKLVRFYLQITRKSLSSHAKIAHACVCLENTQLEVPFSILIDLLAYVFRMEISKEFSKLKHEKHPNCTCWIPNFILMITVKLDSPIFILSSIDSKTNLCGSNQNVFKKKLNSTQSTESRKTCSFLGCRKSYSTARNLKLHVNRQHLGQKFECKVCGKVLETKYSAQRHVLASHKRNTDDDDIQMVNRPSMNSVISIENQDKLIEEQQKRIETLQQYIRQIKLQIQTLRTKLVAKRRLSTELKSKTMQSLIIVRKNYWILFTCNKNESKPLK